jgi:pimeloyl-ACP methyl ester carboxylesterase
MKETALLFGRQQSLVGVLTQPDGLKTSQPAVILLNAGLIHHVGPNRLYVRLARCLAERGFPVLRFDLAGVGDSGVRVDNLPYEQSITDDARQAMDELAHSYGVERFIFMGHCSGGGQSFLTGIEDDRVVGVVLINPQAEREDWLEYDRKRKVQHYYQNYYGKRVLTDSSRWRRFFTGQVSYRSVFRNVLKDVLWSKFSTALFKVRSKMESRVAKPDPNQERVIQGLKQLGSRQTRVLFIYSAGSSGLERLRVMLGRQFDTVMNVSQVQLSLIEGADHTFTLRGSQERVLQVIADWCAPWVKPASTEPEAVEEGVL